MRTVADFVYESQLNALAALEEMTVAVGISPHPSKKDTHVLSFKHNSSPASQFPHTREIKTSDIDKEIGKIHKVLGKQNVVITHHQD